MDAPQDISLVDETVEHPGGRPVTTGAASRARSNARRGLVYFLVVVLLGLVAYGGIRAQERWGRRAMTQTAIVGVESLIEGRADDLKAVSTSEVGDQLTPGVRKAMRGSAILADFSAPVWDGDSAMVRATTGMGEGAIAFVPADGENVVTYRTTGSLSQTAGAVRLVRTSTGWRISGLAAQPSEAPTKP